ncbi:MAG TPA: hypothetical protein DCY93_04220, partial [Firmicutes bacterium]|nr:hypothetical protein [Bacillota bacterium]
MKPRKLLLLPLLLLATLSSCQKKTSSPAGSAGTGTTVSATSSTKPVDVCTTNSGTPLSDVAAANLDKAFDGTVKVTGIKGSDLYVEDQTGGGF